MTFLMQLDFLPDSILRAMHSPHPLALAENVFETPIIGGFNLLQITLAGLGVAAVIGGTRWAFNKALGRRSASQERAVAA